MKRRLAALGLLLTLSVSVLVVWAQLYTSGPQVATFFSDVDDTDQPYGLYLPRDYNPNRKYPLVIMLHAAYSNHRLALRQVFGLGNRMGESDLEAVRSFPRFPDVEYIVAAPLARGTMGYQGIGERDVYDMLTDLKRRFHIDEDRIYLTGASMGGGGALWMGLTRPSLWAAIAAVCPAPPMGAQELAPNALDVPVKLFQGNLDTTVLPAQTRRWHKALVDSGVNVQYIEYPAVRHNAWDEAYKNGAIFDWFNQFRRSAEPVRLHFTSARYKYRDSYWATLDKLTPGTPATIDAKFAGVDRVVVTTKDLDGFTLTLKGHPMATPGKPVSVTVDDTPLHASGAEASFSKVNGRWTARHASIAAGDKHAGAEGPIPEVVASRHIYVYGTADSPSTEELGKRRERATYAASWSTPKRPLQVSFRVMPDTEVTEGDMQSANLVLFGTRETNRVIAKLSPKLPLALTPSAADYGLLFVWPTTPDHYALIASGLPWWTNADAAKRAGLPLLPEPYLILDTMQDFVLFKGGLDSVIAEGYFDSHWQVPPAPRQKMLQTGAVVLR